jgi:hypothetical protein
VSAQSRVETQPEGRRAGSRTDRTGAGAAPPSRSSRTRRLCARLVRSAPWPCRGSYLPDAARKRRQRRRRGLRTRVAEPATSRVFESLAASKRRGTPFDKAWRRAMVRAMDGVPGSDRNLSGRHSRRPGSRARDLIRSEVDMEGGGLGAQSVRRHLAGFRGGRRSLLGCLLALSPSTPEHRPEC